MSRGKWGERRLASAKFLPCLARQLKRSEDEDDYDWRAKTITARMRKRLRLEMRQPWSKVAAKPYRLALEAAETFT